MCNLIILWVEFVLLDISVFIDTLWVIIWCLGHNSVTTDSAYSAVLGKCSVNIPIRPFLLIVLFKSSYTLIDFLSSCSIIY